MKWFLFFFFNLSAFSQTDPCYFFEQEAKEKLTIISNQIAEFESPFYLSKKELLSIVCPEYVTYSIQMNDLEALLVKSNLALNNEKFDLSFGPFQMKISFILKTLTQAPINIINDAILLDIKNKPTSVTSSQIDYLNQTKIQWKLLRLFEYNNKQVYIDFSLKGLYSVYNRGGINKKSTIFKKIKYENKSYEDWCSEFLLYLN